ncbi:hypothetical protein HGM15179_016436 [Zosterops borbonicus]|uniref:Uncharacterized protein n=1 Tax=Zosterops borbonicus TaxID=364589 RepID=A0A8K1G2U2_9PASS|nr:hypothetical protein HGM15179_016436 [Zosterops borbonicus]
MIRQLEHPSSEEGQRELGLLSLRKRAFQGDLIVALQYLKGAYKKAGEGGKDFIPVYPRQGKGQCFRAERNRFGLDRRQKCFIMRVLRHWNKLLREVADVPSLELLKARLDGTLSSLV